MYVLKSLLATVLGFYSQHIWGNLRGPLRKGLFFTDSELNIYMNSENHEKTWLRHWFGFASHLVLYHVFHIQGDGVQSRKLPSKAYIAND